MDVRKENFIKCAQALADYSSWERKLYECGMDLTGTPANEVADLLHQLMCDGNPDWASDTKLGFDWIIEWCFGEATYAKRHGIEFIMDKPGALYEFIVYMNEHGWEDLDV